MTTTVVSLSERAIRRYSLTLPDLSGHIMYVTLAWMGVVVSAVLGGELHRFSCIRSDRNTHTLVIIIVRLHAMYWRSRKVLIFLIIIFLAINVPNGVITARITMHSPGGKI
jgi:hypothetical protein